MRLHDEKPSVADGPSSLAVDLIIWHPKDRSEQTLVELLKQYGFGERSQTVVWLDKFTVRLMMWRRKYIFNLTDDEWQAASQDLIDFLKATAAHYRPKAVSYDTRAFSVGLNRSVRHHKMPVTAVLDAKPAQHRPVWWTLTF